MALGAYITWGLLPLYFYFVRHIPPFEFVGIRVLFTLPLCLLIVSLRKQWPDIRAALASRKAMLAMLASAICIGLNWAIFTWAVVNKHVLATSFGYYLNPLINVALGTAFLGERLTRPQWGAVALAALGVAVIFTEGGDGWWISLSLAISFALYGLVRKVAPVGSLPGLTIETAYLAVPSLMLALWYAAMPVGSSLSVSVEQNALLALSGVLTAVPLLLFALAARRMNLSTLGFVQFLAPTISFCIGMTVFDEPLTATRLIAFVLIWAAVALFCVDLLARRRKAPA